MSTRKWIGTVLITLVVVAVLAASGYALYRFGYTRGAIAASAGEGFMLHDFDDMPFMGGAMGEGYMFHDSEHMPFAGDCMGEGFMPHGFEGMPFAGGHMGERQGGLQGRFEFMDPHFKSDSVPFGYSLRTRMFASPFSFVLRVLFLGLIVWVFYKFIKLFTGGKSWQLSFNSQVEPEPEVEAKPSGRGKAK